MSARPLIYGSALAFFFTFVDSPAFTQPLTNQQQLELELSGPPLRLGEEGFAALEAGNFTDAIAKAEEAIRQRPDAAILKRLLIDALIGSGDLDRAEQRANAFIAAGDRDPEIASRLQVIVERRAAIPAAAAYRAFGERRYREAAASARQAIAVAPDDVRYRMLLVSALIGADDFSDAITAAADALRRKADEPAILALRGYAESRSGQASAGNADFDAAIVAAAGDAQARRELALIAADVALAAGDARRAAALLSGMDDRRAAPRRALAEAGAKDARRLRDLQIFPPGQNCTSAGRQQKCYLLAADAPPAAGVGIGFRDAQAANAALQRGNAAEARRLAERAVAAEPDNVDYQRLLANASLAARDPRGADRAASAVLRSAPRDAGMLALRGNARLQLNRPKEATADFAAAIAIEGRLDWRKQYVTALLRAGDLEAALRAANAVLKQARHDTAMLATRGDIRLKIGDTAGAIADFQSAIRLTRDPARVRDLRLALADAAFAANQPDLVLRALAPLEGERSYEVASRRGYALQKLGRNEEALAALDLAAQFAKSAEDRGNTELAIIDLLLRLNRKAEARARFQSALAAGRLQGATNIGIADIAGRVGEEDVALDFYKRAEEAGQLTGNAALNAGYVAKRRIRNAEAVVYFAHGLDAGDVEPPLDAQRRLEVRREISEIERTFGATASFIYGPVGASALGSLPIPPTQRGDGGNVLQAGQEIYWRPPGIGYRNGATFDLFFRAFETLYDEKGGPVGPQTAQGIVGARWKPLEQANLILEGGRAVALGHLARDDWFGRVAISEGRGTDYRLDKPNWLMWQVYAEANRYFDAKQTLAVAEGRIGQAFRLDGINDHLVVTPFAVLAFNYDNSFRDPYALGAGIGMSARYWFREDAYHAPSSYLDLTVQYRFRLAGDERAEGVFASTSISY